MILPCFCWTELRFSSARQKHNVWTGHNTCGHLRMLIFKLSLNYFAFSLSAPGFMQTKQEITNLCWRLARKFESILLISHILNPELMSFKLMLLSYKYETVWLGSIWKARFADNVFHLPREYLLIICCQESTVNMFINCFTAKLPVLLKTKSAVFFLLRAENVFSFCRWGLYTLPF